MMKNALLLAKNTETPTLGLMRKVLDSLGVRWTLSGNLPKESRAEDSLVVNRNFGMDYDDADLDALESGAYECLNPVLAQRICRDKVRSTRWLTDLGLPQPSYWRELGALPQKGAFVFKTLRGMQGRGVWPCEDPAKARSLSKNLGDENFLVQELLAYDREFRCLILGEEILWYERSGGNLFQGGKAAKVLNPPDEIKRQALLISKDLGWRLGAIDFLQVGGEFYPLDLNAYPGLTMLENPQIYLRRLFTDALL